VVSGVAVAFAIAPHPAALTVAAEPAASVSGPPVDLRDFAVGRTLLQRYLGPDSVLAFAADVVVAYATAAWAAEAQRASTAAAAALPAIAAALDARAPEHPIWIVVSPGGGAMAREAPEWSAALARPGERLVVLSGPALRTGRAEMDATVAHEIAHLVLHQRIGELGWVPQWFDEGVAVQLSGAVGWRDRLATFGRGPVHLRQLTDTFPRDARAARFAYVESAAAVRRLLERGSLVPLLDRLATGAEFDAAFAAAYGETSAEFADRVHAEVGRRWRWLAALGGGVTLGGVMALLVVVAGLRTRLRNRARARAWEAAEAIDAVPSKAVPGDAVPTPSAEEPRTS
jgi:hypothetical protein